MGANQAQQCAPSSLLAAIAKVDKNLGTMWRPRVTLLKFTQSLTASVYPARLLFIKLMPYCKAASFYFFFFSFLPPGRGGSLRVALRICHL